MKKAFTFFLAIVLVFAMAMPVLATGGSITTSGGSGNTNMTYSVAQTFTVTIPEAVTINAEKSGSLAVGVAANAFIAPGKSILIKLSTCDFQLTNGGDNLTYTITNDTPAAVAQGDTVLTHAAGNLEASSKTLALAVTGSAKYSGDYTDQITFTVSVE